MRKSILLFIVLTVFFFGIFAESLAIKKEAAFDGWAEDYIEGETKKKNLSEEGIDEEVSKYSQDEISKEFAYRSIRVAIYASTNLVDACRYLKEKHHRRIPIIGLIDSYSNVYSVAIFVSSSVIGYVNSSGKIEELKNEIRKSIEQSGNMENIQSSDWWDKYKKSEEFGMIIEKYIDESRIILTVSVDDAYMKNRDLKNPNKYSFSPATIAVKNCLNDLKAINERIYSQIKADKMTKDYQRVIVDSFLIIGLYLESNHIIYGVIDPNYSHQSPLWGLPGIYTMFVLDSIILLLVSMVVSVIMVKISKEQIMPLLLGSIIGCVLSFIFFTKGLFFIWCFLGGGIAVYKCEVFGKKDVVVIGVKTGILIFFFNCIILIIMSFTGINFEGNIFSKLGPNWAVLLTTFLDFLIMPILYLAFSVLGAIIGTAMKKPSPY